MRSHVGYSSKSPGVTAAKLQQKWTVVGAAGLGTEQARGFELAVVFAQRDAATFWPAAAATSPQSKHRPLGRSRRDVVKCHQILSCNFF